MRAIDTVWKSKVDCKVRYAGEHEIYCQNGVGYLDDTNVKYMQNYDEGSLGLVAFTKATVRCAAQGVMRELETYEVPQCTETWDASLLAALHHLRIADVI